MTTSHQLTFIVGNGMGICVSNAQLDGALLDAKGDEGCSPQRLGRMPERRLRVRSQAGVR